MINDLTKAIAFFESEIRESDNFSDEQRKHFVVAKDAMLLILSDPITALRLHKQAGDK